jgi:predicted metallopeptidase
VVLVNELCRKCLFAKECEISCPAFIELYKICDEQDAKDKTILIRNLKKLIGIRDAEPSMQLKHLGNKIINHFAELSFIKEWNIKIGYVISQEKKSGKRIVYADCRKVQEVFRAYLPFDFIITFYEQNTGILNENQLKILMLHELKHIGMGERGLMIVPHDIEDFSSILSKYGLDWDTYGKELPDLFGGEQPE